MVRRPGCRLRASPHCRTPCYKAGSSGRAAIRCQAWHCTCWPTANGPVAVRGRL